MIKNYFKTAFRTLTKNRSYAAINIIGLAVSLSTTILILLWVWDELSYDRMHSKGNRIYSLTARFDPDAGEVWHLAPSAITHAAKHEISAIEETARISIIFGDNISFVVAFPLGWWMMRKWLENYAYRAEIEWWVFAVAGLTAFTIAAVTVCGKSLRAARENPVKAIRTE